MNRGFVIFGTLGVALAILVSVSAAQTMTEPSKDIFVENSATNFVFASQLAQSLTKHKVSFDLYAPIPGDYTLACFIDGKLSKPVKFTSPGTFQLSTGGMPPGKYRITLQLVDSKGGVGRVSQTLELK